MKKNSDYPEWRQDQTSTSKNIAKRIHEFGVFSSENIEYENYLESNDLVIEIFYNTEETGLLRRDGITLAILLPLPTYKTITARWIIYNKQGFKKEYQSSMEYSIYPFLLFTPIALVQHLTYRRDHAELLLAEDILLQISADFQKGLF